VRWPELLVRTAPQPVEAGRAKRRRRLICATTLLVGTALIAATLRVPHASLAFTVLGFALAAVWLAGALASGPIRLRPAVWPWMRVVVVAVLLGVGAFAVFAGLSSIGHHLPLVSSSLDRVLATADAGPLPTVLVIALANAVAEEMFFRGALQTAFEPRHPEVRSTVCYVVVTAATANLALVVAAALMGGLFSVERRWSRSVLAPIVTHCTWSTLTLLALPR
jgi:membrane protease YdiL (CAAX protease family)